MERQKTYKNIKPTSFLGECISIASFESPTNGFIVQVKGNLTREWYFTASVCGSLLKLSTYRNDKQAMRP